MKYIVMVVGGHNNLFLGVDKYLQVSLFSDMSKAHRFDSREDARMSIELNRPAPLDNCFINEISEVIRIDRIV